jgi:hypothetical protein
MSRLVPMLGKTLLHGFTKPEGYKKGDKKVNQMIDKEINIAMNRLNDFLKKQPLLTK